MNLLQFIRPDKKDVFQEYADNMQPLQPIQQEIPLVQVQADESLAPVEVAQQPQKRGLTLSERLFGVSATPTDSIDTNTMNATISQNPRVGGLFNDIMSGAKENYATGFAAPNLYENETPDGRKKGFAYRLGEGLGTAGRFLESPLGRGLLTAGIVGATGGNGLQALAYGGQTGLMNQNLRNADNLYRQQLKDNYGFTDEQLAQRKGYIDPNTFNNLTKSQNSAMSIAIRQQTAQSMNRLRELQIEKQRIINSTLPEIQKAKLIQENAKAQYAEEMQLARIQAYQNTAALGWGNLGLRMDKFNYDKAKDAQEAANEQAIIDSLGGGSTPPAMPKSGTTKSGNKWKEVN
jgi:hypothetical protein